MSKTDTHHIIDALGAEALTGIGMSERTIRHARSVGKFAAQWYPSVKFLCEEQGIKCPLSSFSFKRVAKNIGGRDGDFKGAAE